MAPIPGMGIGVNGHVPELSEIDEKEKASFEKSLHYMGLAARREYERKKSGLCFYRQLHQFKHRRPAHGGIICKREKESQ